MRMIFGVMKVSNDRKSDMAGSVPVWPDRNLAAVDTIRKARHQPACTPSRPARSWMNCQATRPDRAPRVIDHSIASACSASAAIGRLHAGGIAIDHGEERVLVAVVEAEPEAEPVGQRHLLLGRLGRVDRGGALVLDHVARHQVAAVGGGVEQHVVGPPLDAALQDRLQRLVVGILALERQVVAQDQAAARLAAQDVQQLRQRADVLAVDLDQRQAAGQLRVDDRVRPP